MMSRALTTIVATFCLALAVGTAAVALNNWFGSSDLVPFGMYCVPFSLIAALAESFLFRATQRLPVWLASACAFLAGLLFGWLGTFAIALSLGPWFGAMSVPMLPVWCITAAFIFSATIALRRAPRPSEIVAPLLGLASLSILTLICYGATLSFLTSDQHLTVEFFRHYPGDTELEILDPFDNIDLTPGVFDRLNDGDRDLLRKTGLRGKIEVISSGSTGFTDSPHATAMIVLTAPIDQKMSAPQPNNCSIVYVQEGNRFRQIPETAPTLKRRIEIQRHSDGLEYWVELPNGGKSGSFIE